MAKSGTSGQRSTGPAEKPGSKILTYLLAVLALLLLIGSTIVGPIGWWTKGLVEGLARGSFLIMAVWIGILSFVRMRRDASNGKPIPDPIYQPGIEWLAKLQDVTSLNFSEFDKGAVISFFELLTRPERYRSRVVETIDLDGRGIRQHVAVEFVLPAAALEGEYLYLPLLQPLKGELLDNFYLTDTSGKTLPNLAYDETTKLAAAGLMSVLTNAIGMKTKGRRSRRAPLQVSNNAKVLELVLLDIIAKRGRIDPKNIPAKVDSVLARLDRLKDEDRKLISAYVISLSASYPIVAVVPTNMAVAKRVIVKYERTLIAASEQGRLGEFRLGLGLRPNQIAIPIQLALSARSYHLRLNGPLDKYIMEQYFECRNCGLPATRDLSGAPESNGGCFHGSNGPQTDSHFRLRRKRGQNFIHLYMRGYYEGQPLKGFQVRARFKEIPPGSRANAMVTALATTVLIGIFGYLVTHHKGASTSGFPGLVLALPTVAASWFGFAADGGKLVGSSLLARLSLMISGVLSLVALAFYLLNSPPAAATSTKNTDRYLHVHHIIPILGIGGLVWPIMLALSASNFIYISWRFAMKLYYYKTLIQKNETESAEYILPC